MFLLISKELPWQLLYLRRLSPRRTATAKTASDAGNTLEDVRHQHFGGQVLQICESLAHNVIHIFSHTHFPQARKYFSLE